MNAASTVLAAATVWPSCRRAAASRSLRRRGRRAGGCVEEEERRGRGVVASSSVQKDGQLPSPEAGRVGARRLAASRRASRRPGKAGGPDQRNASGRECHADETTRNAIKSSDSSAERRSPARGRSRTCRASPHRTPPDWQSSASASRSCSVRRASSSTLCSSATNEARWPANRTPLSARSDSRLRRRRGRCRAARPGCCAIPVRARR
jgi:hypothetical protein